MAVQWRWCRQYGAGWGFALPAVAQTIARQENPEIPHCRADRTDLRIERGLDLTETAA
jgi:hypothetical protein